METAIYFNGGFVPKSEAKWDIDDRGAMFADGIYEVLRYCNGKPVSMQEHMERCKRSLAEIAIPEPPEVARFGAVSDELVQRNGLRDASVYWQITRGAAPRTHLPPAGMKPSVLAIAYPVKPLEPAAPPRAIAAALEPDLRWHRCDIKSLMLLPNTLAKTRAHDAGAEEAILHRGDVVTEGSSTSLIIARRGELWTHPANQWILDGVTRKVLLSLVREAGVVVREKEFTVADLLAADEAMICGTITLIAAVVRVGDKTIGAGRPGELTLKCHQTYMLYVCEQCGI